MAKRFLEGVDLRSQNSRNGFDVSYQNQFTVPFGMLLPCFFQRVNPDDKIKLSNETQTICDGLVKPAFMRLREHLDYYFIPAEQLWMPFDNFITGQNSYISSLIGGNNDFAVPESVPTMTSNFIYGNLSEMMGTEKNDDLGFPMVDGAARLLDMLGYFNLTKFQLDDFAGMGAAFNGTNQKFNLFPLLCYQKVYYDYFRNPKYEDNDTYAYNIDSLMRGQVLSTVGEGISSQHSIKWFKIHYRWQKKDYFTQTQPNVLPDSSQIGYDNLSSTISLSNLFNVPGIGKSISNVRDNGASVNRGNYVASGGLTDNSSSATATNIINQGVSVANIRFAFAYDKLLRRMRESGPDFDAQMLAQFGIAPYDARHGKCYYLGGYTNSLSSSDVTNMTGSGIGELAGQINAYSDNSSKILNYHAKEHGYIIGIYSTSVDNMYQSYRTNRECLLRDRFDWFNPAFENLGLQPVFAAERDYTQFDSDVPTGKGISFDTYSMVIGYVPRYSELKTHPDECHGILCNYSDIVGFREWNVQVNTELTNGQALDRNSMMLSPSQFDAVAGVEYNGKPTTDHFLVNMYTHSHKVSSMSMFEDF